jgi:serine/threonine protein kinase
MELCELNLRRHIDEYIKSETGGSVPEIWSITQQIASGMEYLCQQGAFNHLFRSETGMPAFVGSNVLAVVLSGNIWKLTNLCSSMRLPIVEDLENGTPQYNPPELIFSRQASTEQEPGACWSIGCILYELSTGRRAFPDLYSLLNYWSDDHALPKVTEDSNAKLFGTSCPLTAEEVDRISAMWAAVDNLKCLPILGPTSPGLNSTLDRINAFLGLSLSKKVDVRPSFEQISHYGSANVIRAKLETNQVTVLKKQC